MFEDNVSQPVENVSQDVVQDSEQTPVETQVPQEQPVPKFDPRDADFVRKMTTLTQRESQLQRRSQELKALEEDAKFARELRELRKSNPMEAMKRVGLSYQELTEHALNTDPRDQEMRQLKEELAALKGEWTQNTQRSQEQERNQVIQGAMQELNAVIDKSPDDFELIKMQNRHQDVLDTCSEYYRQTGKFLSFKDAAVEVEKLLEEQAAELFKAKKILSKYGPKQEPKEENPQVNAEPQQRTLSNNMTPTSNVNNAMSARDLDRLALEAFRSANR